jgi:hypothetical protein
MLYPAAYIDGEDDPLPVAPHVDDTRIEEDCP